MSSGVGAVSVRPLELCLWELVVVPAVMRGGGAGCADWPGAGGSSRPGSPNPRGALSAYRQGCYGGRKTTGPSLGPPVSVVPRPPPGVKYPTNALNGVRMRPDPRCQVSAGLLRELNGAVNGKL